jgi:CheY-like chemotaxis protein
MSRPFTILLAEDEPADARLVRAAIERGRIACDLRHVDDGKEALDFLRREGRFGDAPRPDLILLDLNMPRMNGREALRAIKANSELRAIPVVILTTSDAEHDVVSSYLTGAAGYVTKPLDVEQFFAAIHAIEEYWFAIVRRPKASP